MPDSASDAELVRELLGFRANLARGHSPYDHIIRAAADRLASLSRQEGCAQTIARIKLAATHGGLTPIGLENALRHIRELCEAAALPPPPGASS